jgi:CsoR family transcriptional regulator, copper-sensing transcriptional repressor
MGGLSQPRVFSGSINNPYMPKGIPRDTSTKHALLHRLKIARGHLDKVISMVSDDEYCVDVIHQSIAVQSALKKIDQAILKNHMETCVADAIKKGNSTDVINEVMHVLKKSQ